MLSERGIVFAAYGQQSHHHLNVWQRKVRTMTHDRIQD
ncbi:hypothetical protein TGS27_0471 [Geobacillus stearothermophilus]|nr:hypothetical protein TGS27_0471 [Geobacillus stearothermophilus]